MINFVERLKTFLTRPDEQEYYQYNPYNRKELLAIAQRMQSFDEASIKAGKDPRKYNTTSSGEDLIRQLTSPIYGRDLTITAHIDTFNAKLNLAKILLITLPKDQWDNRDPKGVTVEFDQSVDPLSQVKTVLLREDLRYQFIYNENEREDIADAVFSAISQAR